MRITNKIMQENSLYNINSNKINQDSLSTQMSTQKKINRPSEDPVVAIRALRLRSSVNEISQYYSKNIPDATSWLKVTEDALSTVTDVVTDMIKQATKAANSHLTSDDSSIIIENMSALCDEVYSTGDVDYAGRYVFTGYRTDTSLTFTEKNTTSFSITEQLHAGDMDTISHVNTSDLASITSDNYAGFGTLTESAITNDDFHRIRLSYAACDNTVAPVINFTEGGAAQTLTADIVNSYDSPTPYESLATSTEGVVFIADTGELLISDDVYARLNALSDDNATTADESEFTITYTKSSWQKGDLNPEHYFACSADGVDYNQDYLTGTNEKQVISYDVGYNQTIEVNTTADQVFTHDLKRMVEDLKNSLSEVTNMEKIVGNLEKMVAAETDETNKATMQNQLDAANKALDYMKDNMQTLFENSITTSQDFLNQANLAVTDNGTASSRLSLVESRMMDQKTTFETLKSDNEDADITEVAVKLGSAKVTYEASLMATSKIMQTSLLNYL